ncbi:MAG: aminodeoxychorismate synthase component I [Bacteroidota bacterium]
MIIEQQDADHFLNFLNKEETSAKITGYAKNRTPFLFFIDATMENGLVYSPVEAAKKGIFFNFNGITNFTLESLAPVRKEFSFTPVPFDEYHASFRKVMAHIKKGDTYLLNLTFPTPVETGYSLEEIFHFSVAPYKLLVNEHFVLFSPEIFIKIHEGRIFSHPMKGTINASIPGAEELLMNDRKELFEHNTIVDLIRNDLAMVSTHVKVSRFRYLQKITTNRKALLQVSSEITGELPADYLSHLGDIIFTLLPAGSVTGAPKLKTVEIIRNAEIDDRGFYTGICGFFDGHSLDSAVMIRFIEKNDRGLFFRSGGGITALSNAQSEYHELTDKVYVPFI